MKKMNMLLIVLMVMQTTLFAQAQKQFISKDESAIELNVKYLNKNFKNISDVNALKIAKYLAYIQLTPDKSYYKATVSRLLKSSTQFILCKNLEDLACLEAKPMIDPNSEMRRDVRSNLGKPVKAGKKLEIEYYFTTGWYDNLVNKTSTYQIPEQTVAKKLAEKIKDTSVDSISMALYGIDDLAGTMSSVYEAVKEKVSQKVPVRAVVDIMDSPEANGFIRDYDLVKNTDGTYRIVDMPGVMDFSYITPINPNNFAFGAPAWAESFFKDLDQQTKGLRKSEVKSFVANGFVKADSTLSMNPAAALKDVVWLTQNKEASTINNTLTRISYQYNGTMDFMRTLNTNSRTNETAMAHIEYPYSGIMHNKFVIFEDKNKQKAVWTGTANISETCMGSEKNANLSVYVKNTAVAETFQEEFNEMFSPVKGDGRPDTLVTGVFHNKKRPNTNRYFTFTDGTSVRVHFSPTDDAEHRVILPMLYSAKKGDQLRISMFGSGGYELVRALQSAVARGVHIRIAVDKFSGAGLGSWVKSKEVNVFDKNPYSDSPAGSIEVRKNIWNGLNHHKSATLTRLSAGGTYRPEVIVIGSQNWSGVGNDNNDENVISITNKKQPLDIMLAYNKEFDEKIWVASEVITASTPATEGAELP